MRAHGPTAKMVSYKIAKKTNSYPFKSQSIVIRTSKTPKTIHPMIVNVPYITKETGK
jgi:hypothetical protein